MELAAKVTTDYVPEPLRQGASVLFTVLLGYYLFFRLSKRAEIAASQPIRELERERREARSLIIEPAKVKGESEGDAEAQEEADAPRKDLPVKQLWSGAATGLFFTLLSYKFTSVVEGFIDGSGFATDDATVYQLAITFRTILLGLGWLLTGIYGVNTVGLTLLAGRKTLGLDSGEEESSGAQADAAQEGAAQPVDAARDDVR
eukprot:PRCOL_00001575-RA